MGDGGEGIEVLEDCFEGVLGFSVVFFFLSDLTLNNSRLESV